MEWYIDRFYRLSPESRNLSPSRGLFPDRLYCLPRRYRFFKTANRVVVISYPPNSNLKLNIDNSQGLCLTCYYVLGGQCTGYVVVVDDDKMVEEFLEAFLRRADYREKSFSDPRMAFDFIKENRDDVRLVIADLTMPQMTGVQLCEEMTKVVSGIPVILFTGQDPLPLVEDLACNVKIVLQKPLMREEFIRAVASVIGKA